ncbi:MAG TPA: HD domain-containing phosphohydrolase [Gaiellaceae bacterium]|jgi:response regulator RpfG family c-di-GMP phosphodiesterase
MRLLLVDDDPGLRALLRATLDAVDIELDDAEDARAAANALETRRPDAIVLDINLPDMDGLAFCRSLKREPTTREIPIVMLSGFGGETAEAASAAGAEAFLSKPFSPLELLAVVERLAGGLRGVPFRTADHKEPQEQLLLYARDLRHLLEIERGQRHLLENAYHETVAALATALESKDTGTRAHSQRVQRYAVELTKAVDPSLVDDQGAEYGFLLHDVGKIGIPDDILGKAGPLTAAERDRMQTHTVLGEQMLGGVAFLQGEGLSVVRSHHERWDGGGYPDGIAGTDIPVGARIFAVADTLDAMTSNRPYRKAMSWAAAGREIVAQSERQFDPAVVKAFVGRDRLLRSIRREFLNGV